MALKKLISLTFLAMLLAIPFSQAEPIARAERIARRKAAENLMRKIQADNFLKEIVLRVEARKPASSVPDLIPLEPVTPDQMHEKALELVSENKLVEASKLYEEIVLNDPNDDQAYIILGHIFILSGHYLKAESAFLNAVHINNDNLYEITPFYENRILENPEDDVAYSNLGYTYVILGKFSDAKEAFKNALSINPQNLEAMKGLAGISERVR